MHNALRMLCSACALLLLAPVEAAPPEPMPIEFFASPSKFKDARLSPDGKHIAFTFEEGNNETKLGVATTDLKTITAVYAFGDNQRVDSPIWVNNERLAMQNYRNTGYLDGRRQGRRLFVGGYNGDKRRALAEGNYASWIVDPLDSDPEHFLMARINYMGDRTIKLHRVDVDSVKMDFIRALPAPETGSGIVDLALDSEERIRIAMELDSGKERYRSEDDRYRLHYRMPEGEWQSIAMVGEREGAEFSRLGFGPDDQFFYFLSNYDQPGRDTLGAYRLNLASGEIEAVFRHPEVDLQGAVRGPKGEVLGVRYQPGYPAVHYFYPEHPTVKLMQSLDAAFPNQVVRITSYARDGEMATVSVYSDRNPGEMYLFEDGKLRFLAAAYPEADPARLGVQEAFTLEARDGTKLYGYLTLPPGRPDQNLPLVVYPHGGPHGPYDRWGYSRDVQFMASNGYAVLQVNFRGSGGYGDAFKMAGYGEWGLAMQDDVTDATQWAIREGVADPDRICIGGVSYGGYAALQGVVREPDLYQCAIGIVGVYSLPMMQKRGDYRMNPGSSNEFFDDVHGQDQAGLEARSPAYNVDKIKADLLIIHGADDKRVPLAQAKFLRKQLDAIGKDYEWMVRDEGHGFTQYENRVDMYRTMLAFLDRNIGAQRPASANGP